jgi:hypothetical protein
MRLALVALALLLAWPALAQRTQDEGLAAQARFLGIIESFAVRYRATTDFAVRADLTAGRWELLCPVLPRGAFRGWRGVVEEQRDTARGIALAVRLDERVVLSNSLPPSEVRAEQFLIRPSSSLHAVANGLRAGQRVEIDFIPGPRVGVARDGLACLGVLTRSQTGLMEAPVFAVEFHEIRPAR